ncbi:hypothetical protein MSMEI_3423 [Mycolicibacterium smegmatis MC2 155]|uniref:Uncharacterized protein n=1 Tax=Mycolicibacterium smegmatis (strain ATCC 700084 / mc(2)155) TaxID=246196 RepID=I7G9T8_MYCS2|nr:hypothetical protein MSMEI_3423 [Mycolicibacterium smegmatis MC2 155]
MPTTNTISWMRTYRQKTDMTSVQALRQTAGDRKA